MCYIDTDSFVIYRKGDDIYKDITKHFESSSDTLNYELDKPLPKVKIRKLD